MNGCVHFYVVHTMYDVFALCTWKRHIKDINQTSTTTRQQPCMKIGILFSTTGTWP